MPAAPVTGGVASPAAGAPEVEALLAALAADDRVPAHLDLEQDVVFPHLTPAERVRYVERALAIGRAAAREIGEAGEMAGGGDIGADGDIRRLADELGARVVIREREHRFAGMTFRAEHDARTGTITLYRRSVEQVRALLARTLPEPWSQERVTALHVAHELFHHLEAMRIRPVHEQLPAVATFRVGRLWTTRTRARRCREIAAHAFAQALLNLPFYPGAVDWLMLVALGKCTAGQLLAAVERARAALASAAR